MAQLTRSARTCITPPTSGPVVFRSGCWVRPRLSLSRISAKGKDSNDTVTGIINTANGLIDSATGFVPENVPRPAAKAGVTIASGLIVFWLLQKVISGVLTLALLAGAGYYFLTRDSDKDEKPAAKDEGPDLDDPLAEAKRIMKKYK